MCCLVYVAFSFHFINYATPSGESLSTSASGSALTDPDPLLQLANCVTHSVIVIADAYDGFIAQPLIDPLLSRNDRAMATAKILADL